MWGGGEGGPTPVDHRVVDRLEGYHEELHLLGDVKILLLHLVTFCKG